MPHLKCVTCRTRYYTPGGDTHPIEDLCPSCGSAFEPVGALSELIGFRAIGSRDGSAAPDAPGTQQAFVDRLSDLLERRARDAQPRSDGERRPDGSGMAAAEAIALPRPE